jgi:glycine hydroxymethyltransferase
VFSFTPTLGSRPWRTAQANAFHKASLANFAGRSLDELDNELFRLVAAQEQSVDEECITLYAGTNAPNPRAARLLGSTIGSRPNLGAPGDTYNRGMDNASRIEILCDELIGSLFGATYVETRVSSGSLANMYVYLATCKPGDAILAFSDDAAGHVTHHLAGAAGYCGLVTHNMPFDTTRMDVDAAALNEAVARIKPKLIIVAGSMCLFPYNVAAVRSAADTVGAFVMYDAAHMGGMIAGGRFQQPLVEGAHVITGSTYKSFGGPPSGMILANDATLAERLDAIAYPGFTANFDVAKTAALALAARDMHTYGFAYANQCIANAQSLAAALSDEGVAVFEVPGRANTPELGGARPFTVSQHVALHGAPYGGGNKASYTAEASNILFSSIGLPLPAVDGEANGIRLGTQEVTRWGMTEADMPRVAVLVADALLNRRPAEQIRADVVTFRKDFQTVHFVSN